MATARLTDSQKQELVRRFRQGESTQVLADHYGCSTTTITRIVRAELGPEDYASLRDQRQRKAGRDRQIALAIDGASKATASMPDLFSPEPAVVGANPGGASPEEDLDTVVSIPGMPGPVEAVDEDEEDESVEDDEDHEEDEEDEEDEEPGENNQDEEDEDAEDRREEPTAGETSAFEPAGSDTAALAIDDADDFAPEDDIEDDLLTSEEDGVDAEEDAFGGQDFHAVAVLPILVDDQRETRPAPWTPDVLPSCAYLLVDKTVELQARPLADIPELGRLPAEEADQQALVLFTNPRQAKRQCGRTQRVIKLPDPALLGRTASYLRAQGISRVVIEGALYALPGGH
ncbi:MAG: helix-turn-helix domain-containing protein [Cyanobacteriota bacterium]